MYDLDQIKRIIEAEVGIHAAYLFGSVAAGDSVANDLDLLIDLMFQLPYKNN